MELKQGLRLASIIGGIVWGLILLGDWIKFANALSNGANRYFGGYVAQAGFMLLFESCCVIGLFLFAYYSSPAGEKLSTPERRSDSFIGEESLQNDSYVIFLTKKYAIEKNDALSKYICDDNLFNSIQEVLEHADSMYKNTKLKSLKTETGSGKRKSQVIPNIIFILVFAAAIIFIIYKSN